MTARHDILQVTTSEIRGTVNDEKVFSWKPSGIYGYNPIASGTLTTSSAANSIATGGSVFPYSAYVLGNQIVLRIGNPAGTVTVNRRNDPPNFKTLTFTSALPAAIRPSQQVRLNYPWEKPGGVLHLGTMIINPDGTVYLETTGANWIITSTSWLADVAAEGATIAYYPTTITYTL